MGTRIVAGSGPAWQDLQLSVLALPPVAKAFTMPATAEPLIAWTTSGEVEAQEREDHGPWFTSRLKKGSLYVTAGGAPYEFRWRALTSEPFDTMLVLISLPVFNQALADVFGADAPHARLRDVSGFEDPPPTALLEPLRVEATKRSASPLFVRSLAQAIAVHLARNYTALTEQARGDSAALPGFKLRRVTEWMAAHLTDPFSLARVAQEAGMSEFHFTRLFKRSTGLPPSRYQIKLRIETAQRLLRETTKSIISVGNEVGYSNPSYFAQIFRKETGLSPSDYRRRE